MNSFDDAPLKDEKLVNYFMTVLSGINLHYFITTDTDKISPLTFQSADPKSRFLS